MENAADIAVFHLVRAGTDLNVLSQFLGSYERFSSGAPHVLVFLLKGFSKDLPPRLNRLLDSVPHARINCPDRGFDLGSYFFGSARVTEPLVMFTNSFSLFQGDRWLAKILNAFNQPRVGLAGATGSWESLSSQYLNKRYELSRSSLERAISKGKTLLVGLPLLALFPPFPNVHLRTNGFLLERKEFLAMRPRMLRTKLDAWMFESGWNSLTRQVLRKGRDVLVVGRDGASFRPEEWPRSATFWQAMQENLLIHDNRTVTYEHGDVGFRARKSEDAWGRREPKEFDENAGSAE